MKITISDYATKLPHYDRVTSGKDRQVFVAVDELVALCRTARELNMLVIVEHVEKDEANDIPQGVLAFRLVADELEVMP